MLLTREIVFCNGTDMTGCDRLECNATDMWGCVVQWY